MKMKKLIIVLSILMSTSSFVFSQKNETCQFIGEISIHAVASGAFWTCTYTGNPASCSIAIAAHNCGGTPACKGIVKKIVETGCTYTVEVVGDKLKIIGKASKEKIFELQETYEFLNTVEGINWIQRVLAPSGN